MILFAPSLPDFSNVPVGGSSHVPLGYGLKLSAAGSFARLLQKSGEPDPVARHPDTGGADGEGVDDEGTIRQPSGEVASTLLLTAPADLFLSRLVPPQRAQELVSAPSAAPIADNTVTADAGPLLPEVQHPPSTAGKSATSPDTHGATRAQTTAGQGGEPRRHEAVQPQFLHFGAVPQGSAPAYEQTPPVQDGQEGKQTELPAALDARAEIVGVLPTRAMSTSGSAGAEISAAHPHLPTPAAHAASMPALSASAVPAHHDLGATIDRLVEARMAGRAGDVRLAVAHDEFGPVAIRFDASGAGMAANLSSADPDFLPAVNTALAEGMRAERAADRTLSPADPVRAETIGARGNEAGQTGRDPIDAGGYGDPHRSPSDGGSKAPKRIRPGNESPEDGLVSGSQRRSPPHGLYA